MHNNGYQIISHRNCLVFLFLSAQERPENDCQGIQRMYRHLKWWILTPQLNVLLWLVFVWETCSPRARRVWFIIFFSFLGMTRLKEYFTRNKTCPNLNDLDGTASSSEYPEIKAGWWLSNWSSLSVLWVNDSPLSISFTKTDVFLCVSPPSFPCFCVFLSNFLPEFCLTYMRHLSQTEVLQVTQASQKLLLTTM